MMLRKPLRTRDEQGATALMVALLATVLFATAAFAVDISSLAMERQKLHDHVDSAAHAGAYALPGTGAEAQSAALNMANSQDSALNLTAGANTGLFCVVASTGVARTVKLDQIPSTCNPGVTNYTPGAATGIRCNTVICAIPCRVGAAYKCNTIEVRANKPVDYGFAPVIGIDEGNTGSVASAACKGACGSESPNPMDIVVMADRTASMADDDRVDMQNAIKNMLLTMTPSMHYVALGTLHKSRTGSYSGSCRTEAVSLPNPLPWGKDASDYVTQGTWMPVTLRNDYLTSAVTPTANTSSPLYQGVNCLPQSASGEFGTHLAGALKGAARYLMGNPSSTMPARPGNVKKVIIFETDGMPDEVFTSASSALSLGNDSDIGAGLQSESSSAGQNGCNNFRSIATLAKQQNITIITIGFGDAATARCRKGSTSSSYSRVRDVLAAGASPNPVTGAPSTASDCNIPAQRALENTDGDYFFCATEGSELRDIFRTAFISVSDSIKLIRLP